MKKFGIISVILILTFLFFPFSVTAETSALVEGKKNIVYTALGDSIAVGVGGIAIPPVNPLNSEDTFYGYTDMLRDHLDNIYDKVTFNDEAKSGLTSKDLLLSLSNPKIYSAIKNADIITVSIGGNDILQTIIQFGISNPEIIDKLMNKAELTKEDIIIVNSLIIELGNNLNSFIFNWYNIINTIRNSIHSTAEIYVNNLYNPFKPEDPLYAYADMFIQGINDGIDNEYLNELYNYKIADVYTKFNGYNNDNKILVHDIYSIDPDLCFLHPTEKGYEFIFNLHKELMLEN
ncbi:MAG: conserved repeat protein [Clostridia bacterium]|nr:conserved repeat protein [Clostridia bacterium]